MAATGLAKMEKLEEKRNKKHTYLAVTVMIPTGQGTMNQKSENEVRRIFRTDTPFTVTMEPVQGELWKDAVGEDDDGQSSLDVDN